MTANFVAIFSASVFQKIRNSQYAHNSDEYIFILNMKQLLYKY